MNNQEKINILKEVFAELDGWVNIEEKSFYYISEGEADNKNQVGFYYDDEKISDSEALSYYEIALEKLTK